MKYILLIVIILFLPGCGSPDLDVPPVNNHFDDAGLEGLSEIVSFADSIVLNSVRIKDVDQAYHKYLDSMVLKFSDIPGAEVAFDQDLKYSFLSQIDQSLFNKT